MLKFGQKATLSRWESVVFSRCGLRLWQVPRNALSSVTRSPVEPPFSTLSPFRSSSSTAQWTLLSLSRRSLSTSSSPFSPPPSSAATGKQHATTTNNNLEGKSPISQKKETSGGVEDKEKQKQKEQEGDDEEDDNEQPLESVRVAGLFEMFVFVSIIAVSVYLGYQKLSEWKASTEGDVTQLVEMEHVLGSVFQETLRKVLDNPEVLKHMGPTTVDMARVKSDVNKDWGWISYPLIGRNNRVATVTLDFCERKSELSPEEREREERLKKLKQEKKFREELTKRSRQLQRKEQLFLRQKEQKGEVVTPQLKEELAKRRKMLEEEEAKRLRRTMEEVKPEEHWLINRPKKRWEVWQLEVDFNDGEKIRLDHGVYPFDPIERYEELVQQMQDMEREAREAQVREEKKRRVEQLRKQRMLQQQ
ncbi:hypothetical protein QOT17_004845 [Balamuthia mandrillaris]